MLDAGSSDAGASDTDTDTDPVVLLVRNIPKWYLHDDRVQEFIGERGLSTVGDIRHVPPLGVRMRFVHQQYAQEMYVFPGCYTTSEPGVEFQVVVTRVDPSVDYGRIGEPQAVTGDRYGSRVTLNVYQQEAGGIQSTAEFVAYRIPDAHGDRLRELVYRVDASRVAAELE